MASTFRGVIEFFTELGIYDVILPFLLVFTIVFAILEKSKVFGTEKIGDTVYTRKNLNSMVAFVIGFLVVASTQVVAIINTALAHMILLLLLVLCFILLIGVFMSGEKEVILEGGWKTFFMVLMFIGIILIFLNAIGWLGSGWDYVVRNWSSATVGSIFLLAFVVGFMFWITKEPKKT